MNFLNKIILCVAFISGLYPLDSFAGEWDRLKNLKGYWKFSIGDDMKWADPNYNDDNWEGIAVPAYWEDEGFYGYNGYAWYRKEFDMPSGINGEIVYLDLGYIDDIDQTFINGNLVGSSGTFPPNYQTAYNAHRRYPVPVKYLKSGGKNVIAVRVYDAQMGGGICSGDPGIYLLGKTFLTDYGLEGFWKFSLGDNKKWKEPGFDDRNWKEIVVPGFWESQGYANYDGFAWYRKTFRAPDKLKDKRLVLLMGRIDDLDQVYLNGKLIGQTGDIHDEVSENSHSTEYQEFRGYFIPEGLLKINGDNVIAVRVYDDYIDGGIYQGPIGIISQDKYTRFWRDQRKTKKNFFDLIFDN